MIAIHIKNTIPIRSEVDLIAKISPFSSRIPIKAVLKMTIKGPKSNPEIDAINAPAKTHESRSIETPKYIEDKKTVYTESPDLRILNTTMKIEILLEEFKIRLKNEFKNCKYLNKKICIFFE